MSEEAPTVDITNNIVHIAIDGDDDTGDRRVTLTLCQDNGLQTVCFELSKEEAHYIAISLLGVSQDVMVTNHARLKVEQHGHDS